MTNKDPHRFLWGIPARQGLSPCSDAAECSVSRTLICTKVTTDLPRTLFQNDRYVSYKRLMQFFRRISCARRTACPLVSLAMLLAPYRNVCSSIYIIHNSLRFVKGVLKKNFVFLKNGPKHQKETLPKKGLLLTEKRITPLRLCARGQRWRHPRVS